MVSRVVSQFLLPPARSLQPLLPKVPPQPLNLAQLPLLLLLPRQLLLDLHLLMLLALAYPMVKTVLLKVNSPVPVIPLLPVTMVNGSFVVVLTALLVSLLLMEPLFIVLKVPQMLLPALTLSLLLSLLSVSYKSPRLVLSRKPLDLLLSLTRVVVLLLNSLLLILILTLSLLSSMLVVLISVLSERPSLFNSRLLVAFKSPASRVVKSLKRVIKSRFNTRALTRQP